MLEQLLIFTRGGLILWTCKELGNALRGSPIDTLIRSCILEERSGAASYNYDIPGAAYTLKWTFHNELGIVFVAIYQKILHLLYVDDLLAMVKQEFVKIYDPKRMSYIDFDETFRQLRIEAESRAEDIKKAKQVIRKPVVTNSIKKQGQFQKSMKKTSGGDESRKDDADDDDTDDDDNDIKNGTLENGHSKEEIHNKGRANSKENGNTNARAFDVNKLQKLRAKGGKKVDPVVNKVSKEEPKKKMAKKNRVWDDKPAEKKLDFTDPVSENGDGEMAILPVIEGESMMDTDEILSSDSEIEEDDQATNDKKLDAKKKGWFTSMFQR